MKVRTKPNRITSDRTAVDSEQKEENLVVSQQSGKLLIEHSLLRFLSYYLFVSMSLYRLFLIQFP